MQAKTLAYGYRVAFFVMIRGEGRYNADRAIIASGRRRRAGAVRRAIPRTAETPLVKRKAITLRR